MPYPRPRVRELIDDIRARWRRRAVLQGAALVMGVLAIWGSALLLLHWTVGLRPAVLVIGAALGGLVSAILIVRYILRPALRQIDDRQIALFVEERIPELEDRLNSAVEIDDPAAARRAHGVLIDRLIDDAAERARSIPLTAVVDRHKERLLAGASAIALIVFLALGYASFDELRVSFATADLAALVPAAQPLMTVEPGNVEIEQGASQEVVVSLRTQTDRDVLMYHRSGDGAWQKEAMQPALGEPAYLHEFVDVQEPIEYFVAYDQQRSDPFTISLYTFPEIAQIDLTYTYPAYTGRAPHTEENSGDIYGLKGSTVTLEVATEGAVDEAALVLDDERRLPLEPLGDGRFRGQMRLETEGFYHVLLTDRQQKHNKFPEEFRIVPVDDERPFVTVVEPQRDVRANAVEEVLVAVRAEDDFGIADVRLRFAVNGGQEKTIPLKASDDPRPTDVEGEHLFFLEDYALEPGDVISYFVEVEDLFHETPEATDMYFIEVIPFDREYAQVSGGGGMPGGGASAVVLNQQQIIAATWKLHRERAEMHADDYASSRRALVQAQENLRRNIEQRINATAFSLELQQDETNRKIAALLRSAVTAMKAAVDELEEDRLRAALNPEREALNALLKADALNKEQRIALNRGGQGSGNASATEERMTELMDLELDISKDKYEILPPSSGSSSQGEMDEALQKLRDLARRQQNVANESRRELKGEDRRRQVERLQRDQDELRRETESLSQSLRRMARRDNRLGEEANGQLDRIARNMQEAERALREGDAQRAQARQQQALNDLDRLTRDLRMATNDSRRQSLEEMDRRFDQLREQEQQLARDLEREAAQTQARGGRVDPDALERLAAQRKAAREGLEQLDQQAETLAGHNADNPDLASAARNLRQRIRREGLDEQMRDSEQALERGWLDSALRKEADIQQGVQRLKEAMRAFDGHLPVTDEERLARSLDALRALEQELRALEQGETPPSDQEGRSARAQAASRQARLQRAREQMERLQQDIAGLPGAQALNGLNRALARADHAGVSLQGEAAEAFFNQEIFSPLSQLEEALTRALDQIAMDKKLYGSRPGEVPAAYRELVEKYYESLSKSGGR